MQPQGCCHDGPPTECAWCGASFRPRRGGSRQRFCGPKCRTAFWTALRQWGERAVAAGILTIGDIRNGDPAACTLLLAGSLYGAQKRTPALMPPRANSSYMRQCDFERLLARTYRAATALIQQGMSKNADRIPGCGVRAAWRRRSPAGLAGVFRLPVDDCVRDRCQPWGNTALAGVLVGPWGARQDSPISLDMLPVKLVDRHHRKASARSLVRPAGSHAIAAFEQIENFKVPFMG